jgi:hypothetical protein
MPSSSSNGWHVPVAGQGSFIDLSGHFNGSGGSAPPLMLPLEEAAENPNLKEEGKVPNTSPDPGTSALGCRHRGALGLYITV